MHGSNAAFDLHFFLFDSWYHGSFSCRHLYLVYLTTKVYSKDWGFGEGKMNQHVGLVALWLSESSELAYLSLRQELPEL